VGAVTWQLYSIWKIIITASFMVCTESLQAIFGVQKVSPDRKAGITATNRIYIQSFLTVVQTSD
jgi:hypothetical protein